MKARRWLFLAIGGVALALVAGRAVAGTYSEWSWFEAMGASSLYQMRLVWEWVTRGGAFALALGFAWVNLYAVRRSIVSLVLPRRLANFDFGEEVPGNRLNGLVLVLAVVLAVVLAAPMDDWLTLAQARFGLPFAERDPYFDREFAFYLYALPLLRLLHEWATTVLLVVGGAVVLLYALTPSLRWSAGRLHVSTYVRRHLAVLGALVLMLVGWSAYLDGVSLLAKGGGPLDTFTAFDDRVVAPLLTSISIGAMAASLAFFLLAWRGLRDTAITLFVLAVLATPLTRLALPIVDRWSTPAGERAARERPYEATRTQFARRAFGVDQVVDADALRIPGMTRLEASLGVSLWDAPTLVRSSELVHRDQRLLGTVWTPSASGLTADVLQRGSREPGVATTTRFSAVSTDEQGRLPALAVEDPPTPPVLVEPGAEPWAVVADSAGDLPAPAFGTRWERLAHAWRLQNPRLLATAHPEPRPRILLHREVRELIATLAPFFTAGPTVQSVIAGDSLYWVSELFVTSSEYPLARPILFAGEQRNYARFAGMALVNAHTGRMRVVTARGPDAMTRTWMSRLPWLFVSPESLGSALAAALPPAMDRALLQADAIAREGYPGDSMRTLRVATARDGATDPGATVPRLFALHGDTGPMAAAVAVLESDDRIAGVVLARGGVAPRVEWHRLSQPIAWRGVLDSLWAGAKRDGLVGTRGGADRRGQVQVVPLVEGAVFVQPFYAWSNDRPPALRGVSVLAQGHVRSAPTLAEALDLGRSVVSGQPAGLRVRVNALYEQMGAAMRRGDWRAFGDAYAALGRLLRGAP